MNTSKHLYYRRSRISEKRFRGLMRTFGMDLTASGTAELIGLSARSVNDIYLKIRRHIAESCEAQVKRVSIAGFLVVTSGL